MRMVLLLITLCIMGIHVHGSNIDSDTELVCIMQNSSQDLRIGDDLLVDITYRNEGKNAKNVTVPADVVEGYIIWGVKKAQMGLQKGDTPVRVNNAVYQERWVDNTRMIILQEGRSTTYRINLRAFFVYSHDEEGEYTFELEANGVKAEPLKFTIKKRENVILSRTITVPKEKDWEAIVEEQPMEKDDPSTTHFIVRQRFPGETYRDMILLKEKPIDLKISDPNYHGRFFVWVSEKGLHSIEPLKINFYRPGTKLPAEDYFTWERQGLASIEKIVCTESKEKRSTIDITVTLKTKDGKSLDAVLRIETYKLRFLRSTDSSK